MSGGSTTEFLVEGIELALPSNFVVKEGELARVMQRVANMKRYHAIYKHAGVDDLNKWVADGSILDGIKLQSISCKVCEAAKAKKSSVSRKHQNLIL